MREPKFDVGDVVRIANDEVPQRLFSKIVGKHLKVIAVHRTEKTLGYEIEREDGGLNLVIEDWLEGVPLEEVQRYYADKPRRGFIVDGLTVDELESGQDEAYKTFRTAANEANREELCREAEDARKERKLLEELIVTAILWAVLTIISLVMWVIVMDRTGERLFTLIGMVSAYVGFFLMTKPIGTLVGVAIALCRERCKALKERREKGHGGEDPHNMG